MSDAIGSELAQLAGEIWAWQRATFGDGCTVHGAVAKIRDEVYEAVRAFHALNEISRKPWSSKTIWMAAIAAPRRALHEELADGFFMTVQLAGALGSDDFETLISHPGVLNSAPLLYQLGRFEYAAETLDPAATFHEWMLACDSVNAIDVMPAAIRAKLDVNKARTWAKPAEDGTISHVKGHDNE